jgi:hypothetical protein
MKLDIMCLRNKISSFSGETQMGAFIISRTGAVIYTAVAARCNGR